MTEKCAWVTLATNDSYSLGALVLAHSLRRVATQHNLVILITPGVTAVMKERLQSVFSEVITVDVLDSKDAAHLALLSRPELGITFTKIHCWTLTQYQKCVFLDADTLVFKNCDELFEREELSAAPDVGWPDCFNSGVFVYRPSNETFEALVKFAQEKGSFDGGDQGLLNQFFSNWASEDIKKHLPFAYNVCTTAFYSYLPALKQYGSDMKIMHFIGNLKPWLQKFNWSSRSVAEEGHLQAPLQYWWDIFLDKVHPCLDAAMAQWECDVSNEARYRPPQDESSPFPWHHIPIPDPDLEQYPSTIFPTDDFCDPWENYTPRPTVAPAPPASCCSESICTTAATENSNDEVIPITLTKPWYETYIPNTENVSNEEFEEWHDSQSNQTVECGPGGSHCGSLPTVSNDQFDKPNEWQDLYNAINSMIIDQNDASVVEKTRNERKLCDDEEIHCHDGETKPRHPYDNYYLFHKTIIDPHGCKRCTHEELPPDPSPPPSPSEDSDTDLQAGLAGALSQLSLGTSEQGSAVEEHLRRQGWEAGNIDYMGADAFNNIWAKISQTLSSPPAQTPSSPPSTPAPSTPPVESVKPIETPVQVVTSEIKPLASPTIAEENLKKKVDVPSAPQPSSQEVQTGAKDSKAVTEEQKDSKQAATEEIKQSAISPNNTPSPRPIEKLVCHLTPIGGTEPLVTPENEHEDAATIALSIIAREEALSTPTVTSATPTGITPISPAILQNIKDLSVDTSIPETPPVTGPVSLAQIGVKPSTITEKSIESIKQSTEESSITAEDKPEEKTCSIKSEKKPIVDSKNCPVKLKEKSAEIVESLTTKDEKPKQTEIVLSCILPSVEKLVTPVDKQKSEPPVEETVTQQATVAITKEIPSTVEKLPEKPSEKKSIKKLKAEPSVEKDTTVAIKDDPPPTEPKILSEKKEETPTTATKDTIVPPTKTKKVLKKSQPPIPEKDDTKTTDSANKDPPKEITTIEPKITDIISKPATETISSSVKSSSESVKEKEIAEQKDDPTKEPIVETPVVKPKKMVKKPQPPTPKQTTEEVDVTESNVEVESAKKGEDKPVPPPRKKEKKPKDKK